MRWFNPTFQLLATSSMSSSAVAKANEGNSTQAAPLKVTFMNHYGVQLVGHIYHPPNFDPQESYAGIVTVGPAAAVKEHASANYARRMAAEGFVTIAFDNLFQGESGGSPRLQENPHTRIEDIHAAVDHFTTAPYVDNTRIGVLGICAGGGYSANVAMVERRIKAVGLVVPVDGGRGQRAGGNNATIETLQTIWHNKTPFSSLDTVMNYDSFYLADQLLTQPLQVIVGSVLGSYESNRHGHIIYGKAASSTKNITVLEGASHFDMYDKPQYVEPAVCQLAQFYRNHLV